jgi:hypothetical protein
MFWRYWTYPQGIALGGIGDEVTEIRYPYQGDIPAYDRVYLGGYDHEISDEEAAVLTDAGYGEYIT